MSRYSFIEVHSKTPKLLFCEICDHRSKEVTKYYKYTCTHNVTGTIVDIDHNALDCCLHLGDVIDWIEEE